MLYRYALPPLRVSFHPSVHQSLYRLALRRAQTVLFLNPTI
jgi:hypothetical protein